MAGQIQVKPTNRLHGAIYFTNKIIVQPGSTDWRALPVGLSPSDQTDKDKALMSKVEHYHGQGKIEVKGRKTVRKGRDEFWCSNKDAHKNFKVPATNDGLCSHCFLQKNEEIFKG